MFVYLLGNSSTQHFNMDFLYVLIVFKRFLKSPGDYLLDFHRDHRIMITDRSGKHH